MPDKSPEWITLSDAAERLGVHRNTMRRRVDQWNLATRQNPRNLRERLVDWTEVEEYLEFNSEGKDPALTEPGRDGNPVAAATAAGPPVV
jgi:transposase